MNDASTTGDVFTSASGNDGTGDGSSGAPYLTLTFLYSNVDLNGGDTVFVDAGTYTNPATMSNSGGASNDAGTSAAFLVLKGAGTALTTVNNSSAVGDVLFFLDTEYVFVCDMTITTVNGRNNDAVACWIDCYWIVVVNCNLNHEDVAGTAGAVQFLGDSCCVAHCTITTMGWGVAGDDQSHIFNNDISCNNAAAPNDWGISLGSTDDMVVESNIVKGVAGCSRGIQLTNTGATSDNVIIQNNSISGFEDGFWTDFSSSGNNKFYHNSIYATNNAMTQNFNNWDIRNNILYTTSSNSAHRCFYNIHLTNLPTTLDYNLYYHPNAAQAAQISAMTYADLATFQGGTAFETNGLESDPQYTAPATHDLSIPLASPAIDQANVIGSVTIDVQSLLRPNTNTDIGAYEEEATIPGPALHLVLPVVWLQFEAIAMEGENYLQWSTLEEWDNTGFVVQRSQDGRRFENIGWVPGSGNTSSKATYQFVDNEIGDGIYFYRLIQQDFDGQENKSSVTSVMSSLKSYTLGYDQSLQLISLTGFEVDELASIRIVDVQGKNCFEQVIKAEGDKVEIEVNKSFVTGIYLLELTTKNGVVVEKLVL